jgi:cyclic 2,3-diphosphoglycerate synthase
VAVHIREPSREEIPIRCVVVVDGEHYPPVVESALNDLAAQGYEIALALVAGGREKLPASGEAAYGDVAVSTGDDTAALLDSALARVKPDEVVDLSDEPVLDYRRRHLLASVALSRGVVYSGPDFRFSPPPRPRLAAKPSIAIIGTGKRTGKTAVASFAARTLTRAGHSNAIVAMGRGGPPEPELLRGDEIELTPEDLLAIADEGRHAASDYVEDALLGRVPTVGCRRCGGGLAGGVEISNVPSGVALANELPVELLLLEGSGSAIPPVHADVTGLIAPASIPEEHLLGYMGAYRLLLSDFVVVTMCENPFGSPSRVSSLISQAHAAIESVREQQGKGGLRVVRTVFRPAPTRSVEGSTAYVATTAPEDAGDSIRNHLQQRHGCEVVGISHSLSDRRKLEGELEALDRPADVLLCEIKAAGIDVATRWGLANGVEVVYMDNVPEGVEGDDPAEVIEWAASQALERSEQAKA